ncbi:hypothetical protein RBH26_04890 [Natronolimnohabitans sp. A-GB9]|uniref:hypothetical protein n=1 Tax=Natronolimnohabitans sp. A-GB9 TaxID=3069757 RepID=UPI0027B7F0C3|nr:hypothetical protein [Natronolimnohabitans sp. A-GB9]MDQ2049813.1 hypothetical protein [Natronolimnohabitans sp. A-GB9]
MTPVAFLVGFCAAMAAVALGRLATDDTPSPVDVGSALTVIGITLVSASWAIRESSLLSSSGQVLIVAVGLGVGGAGVAVVVHYWE